MEWPKVSENMALYDCVTVDLTLFVSLRTLHDVICMSEFVLFNNAAIFVLLFGKTAELLLSSMTWVEETKDSLILVTCLRKDKM